MLHVSHHATSWDALPKHIAYGDHPPVSRGESITVQPGGCCHTSKLTGWLPSQPKRPCSQSWGIPPRVLCQPMDRPPGRCSLGLRRRASFALSKTGKSGGRPPKAEATKTANTAVVRKVHVGCDGSGIGAAVLALESIPCLGEVVHEFASEENALVRRVLTFNFRHIKHVDKYDDSTFRDIARTRHVDLYFNLSPCPLKQDMVMSIMCLHPCPTLHSMPCVVPSQMRVSHERAPTSLQERFNRAEGVSGQLLAGIDYIKAKHPLAFVIERLRAFTWGRHRPCFHKVLKMLKGIKGSNGKQTYQVQWKCLDAKTHGGLPRSRPRVFITGIVRAHRVSSVMWPRKLDATPLGALLDAPSRKRAASPDLYRYPDATVINLMLGMQRVLARGGQPLTQAWVIDCNSDQAKAVAKGKLPNSDMGGPAGLFVTDRGRMLTIAELLRLTGITPLRLHVPPDVSEAQFAAMVSATVCVPMLARVTINLCKALGIVPMQEKALQHQSGNSSWGMQCWGASQCPSLQSITTFWQAWHILAGLAVINHASVDSDGAQQGKHPKRSL